MRLQLSEKTIKAYSSAFESCHKLMTDIEGILKYLIEKQPNDEVIINMSLLEIDELDSNYHFYIEENGRVAFYSDEDGESGDIVDYQDSAYMVMWIILDESELIESYNLENEIHHVESAYSELIDLFADLFKTIISEQEYKYVIENVSMCSDDDGKPYRFTLNPNGDIIYYKDEEHETYMQEGKCMFLKDKTDFAPLSLLFALLGNMNYYMDKKVKTYSVFDL